MHLCTHRETFSFEAEQASEVGVNVQALNGFYFGLMAKVLVGEIGCDWECRKSQIATEMAGCLCLVA